MDERERIVALEREVTVWLIRKDVSDFRWIQDEERYDDDAFVTCLIIDGDANLYFWEQGGLDEVNLVSEKLGFFAEPRNNIDIGFYSIE